MTIKSEIGTENKISVEKAASHFAPGGREVSNESISEELFLH